MTAMFLRTSSGLRRGVALVLLILVGACMNYVPASVEQVKRPDRVRVRLSVPGTYELMDLTANRVIEIDGEVVRWDDEELVLSAWWLAGEGGLEFRGVGETVVVRREHIGEIERRKVSPVKTAGLIGAGVLATALGVATLASPGGTAGGAGEGEEK